MDRDEAEHEADKQLNEAQRDGSVEPESPEMFEQLREVDEVHWCELDQYEVIGNGVSGLETVINTCNRLDIDYDVDGLNTVYDPPKWFVKVYMEPPEESAIGGASVDYDSSVDTAYLIDAEQATKTILKYMLDRARGNKPEFGLGVVDGSSVEVVGGGYKRLAVDIEELIESADLPTMGAVEDADQQDVYEVLIPRELKRANGVRLTASKSGRVDGGRTEEVELYFHEFRRIRL